MTSTSIEFTEKKKRLRLPVNFVSLNLKTISNDNKQNILTWFFCFVCLLDKYSKIRRAKTVRYRRKMANKFNFTVDTSVDHDTTTDQTQFSNDEPLKNAEKLAEVITGNTRSIFFQFSESLTDIRGEKLLIACFGSNENWQKNPMNHIYSLKLHFSLNLRWKFYVLCIKYSNV